MQESLSVIRYRHLLGFRNRDSGHAIENVVYFELLRRGYDVAIGKVDSLEVNDNYEKIVLSMNPGLDSSYEGIKSVNLMEWLMEE